MSDRTSGVAVIRWEDPPPRRRTVPPAKPLITKLGDLAANPKRWAVLSERVTPGATATAAAHLRTAAKKPANADHRWEFISRGTTVYGRYLGPAE